MPDINKTRNNSFSAKGGNNEIFNAFLYELERTRPVILKLKNKDTQKK